MPGAHVLLSALVALVLAVSAGAGSARAADVPFPMVPKAQAGTQCVDDPAEMRRTHMKKLGHGRDMTLRQGVRGRADSLQGCIDCHTVTDASTGQAVPHTDPRHFCTACHTYVAVQPDCFQCHTSLPSWQAGSQASR